MSLFSKIKMLSKYGIVGISRCNIQFYSFSAHGAHKVVFLNSTVSMRPTIAFEPIFRHASHARKTPVQYKLCASPSLMLSPESSFSNSISISVSLGDSCMPTLPFFEDLFSLFQMAFLLLVSRTAKTISSTDTPATASCTKKLC